VRLQPQRCHGCDAPLAQAPVADRERRQVLDVPEPPPVEIIDYQRISKICPGCGTVNAAG